MATPSAIDIAIVPPTRDLGDGFTVRRALPDARRRMVGPFIFFDQMGPAVFRSGEGLDVRPHPHIGLATVTYLFEGEILHRDSLGTVQPIRPGAVNWMTAGRGIVHSERSPQEERKTGGRLFGIQTWVALPREHEEREPSFVHHPEPELPVFDGGGVTGRLIAGTLFGMRSPVRTYSDMFYADVKVAAGSHIALDAEHEERAVYITEGVLEIDGTPWPAGQMLVLRSGGTVVLHSPSGARILLLGGATMDGPRHIWWNFVSSSRERIREAGAAWKAGEFPAVPEETEFIPLPEQPQAPVNYP
ncbi:MAG: pirin family protein [Steroidobacteraceae bacterium]|nr:pirin family protein [Steroidobacteraceae bacterium]